MSKFVPVVVAIIRNKQDEFLLTQRNSIDWPDVHLKWQLPGGKVEFGETTEQAIERECEEEIGQEVNIISPLPSVKTHIWHHPGTPVQHTLLVAYLCELTDEKKPIKLNSETISFRWCSVEEMIDMDLLPNTLEMIEELNK